MLKRISAKRNTLLQNLLSDNLRLRKQVVEQLIPEIRIAAHEERLTHTPKKRLVVKKDEILITRAGLPGSDWVERAEKSLEYVPLAWLLGYSDPVAERVAAREGASE